MAVCLSAGALLGQSTEAAPSQLWKGTATLSGNVPVDYFLELRESGSAVSGRIHMTWGWEAVGTSHVEGPRFTLGLNGGIPIKVEGEHRRETLNITILDPRSPPFSFIARPAEHLPEPPAPVPPPALADLSAGRPRVARPPMGWNSWNHFAERIDDAAVRGIADTMVASGMRDAGYTYVLIDDGWAGLRDSSGRLSANAKFPDMAALAAYVHARGLKFGLYSSPGPKTCGAYAGSFAHEEQDAKTLAAWGVDYLKYDWCSAGEIYRNAEMRAVFQRMGSALQHSGRRMVYAICQYGLEDVSAWGAKAGGSLWRVSADIQDNWRSMRANALAAEHLAHTNAAQWNDPDLLEVGNGGMSEAEYRTHMSLWALLSAPLIAGNDPRQMDAAARAILLNREVIAVDQDALGRPATIVLTRSSIEVWRKAMADGSVVLGFVNTGATPAAESFSWHELGLERAPQTERELWTSRSLPVGNGLSTGTIATHDTLLVRVQLRSR